LADQDFLSDANICRAMTTPYRTTLLLGLLFVIGQQSASGQVHRLDWQTPYQSRKFEFLKPILTGRNIVQLGESIHMTDEFPRVRLQLVQYLHEQMGFDVLALEGSAVDSWLAQDLLYRSSAPSRDRAKEAQREAWFGLWQTDAMSEVMNYVLKTQTEGGHPLYLASFDIQPGSGRAFATTGKDRSIRTIGSLFDAVGRYAPPPDNTAFDRWKAAFSPFTECFGTADAKSDKQRNAMDVAFAEFETWLNSAALRIQPSIHGRALRLVSASLRGTFELCSVAPGRPFGGQTYQRIRDRLNALNALTIRDNVSASGRIILWAHHSHVNHNASGQGVPSMGQTLHETIGNGLYTIGLFAGAGEAIEVDDTADTLPVKPLRPASDFGIERSLEALASFDFFLDLSHDSALPIALRQASTGRMEIGISEPFILNQDFSAAIFLHQVTAPEPFATQARSPGK
jgi:erythromycin esterase